MQNIPHITNILIQESLQNLCTSNYVNTKYYINVANLPFIASVFISNNKLVHQQLLKMVKYNYSKCHIMEFLEVHIICFINHNQKLLLPYKL